MFFKTAFAVRDLSPIIHHFNFLFSKCIVHFFSFTVHLTDNTRIYIHQTSPVKGSLCCLNFHRINQPTALNSLKSQIATLYERHPVCKISLSPLPTFLILGTLKADASRCTKARCVFRLSFFRFYMNAPHIH